jgi:hypothetical protein
MFEDVGTAWLRRFERLVANRAAGSESDGDVNVDQDERNKNLKGDFGYEKLGCGRPAA